MTLTKKILLAVAGLLLALVAAAAWLVLTFDANRYKGVAVEWVQTHYQRTLAMGDIGLSVFPRLEVRVDQLSLSEFQQPSQRFVGVESARLAVQLLPLLKQQLVVDQVQVRGVALRYSRDEQGKRNIDDLLQPRPAPETATAPAGQPLHFDVSGIALDNIQVQLDDRMAPLQGELTLVSLQTGRLSPELLTPVSLKAQARLRQPALSADLGGAFQIQLDPGDGQNKPLKLALRQLALTLGLDTGSLKLKDSTLALERFELFPAEQRLAWDKLALRVQGGLQAGAQPFKLGLNWPQLAIHGQQFQASALSGDFALQGPAALQGTLSTGTPSGSFEAIQIPGLKLQLGVATQGEGASRVNGVVQTDVSAQLKTQALALNALRIDASVQNPALKPLKIDASGQVNASPQQAGWTLAGQLNQQAFHTEGQLALGGKVPKLQAQARFGELDLDALLPPRPASAPEASPAADVPVNLAGLRAIDAQVKLQAGSLKYQPFVVRDLLVQAAIDGGRLVVAPLSLKTWEGSVEGRLSADASQADPAQQRLAVQAQAQNILIQSVLKDVAQTDMLEGRGLLKLDVTTSGASVNAFKAALGGTAALQLRDGAIKGINLAQKLREVKAALSFSKNAQERAKQTEKTDFSELSASFQISKGVAQNRDLDMKSPFLRLAGAGKVDLPASTMDYTARATVASTSKGQDGADAVKGLTVPVRLAGPFTALDWHILWTEVSLGGTGNTLQAAGDALKAQVGDPLKAKLAAQIGASASAPLADQAKDKAKEAAKAAAKDKLKGLFGQ